MIFMSKSEKKYAGAYILDTNIFRPLFNFIYRDVFPEIWEGLERLSEQNKLCSVAEVRKEYEFQLSHRPEAVLWAKEHSHLFLDAEYEDAVIVKEIYEKYPECMLKPKDILKKKTHADVFLVAKGCVLKGCVVTDESKNSNSQSKIPNICKNFNVDCINLHDFLMVLKNMHEIN